MRPSDDLKNRILLNNQRVHLVCMKFQAHISSEKNTGIQPGPDTFDESTLVMIFLINLGVTSILYSFRLVLERKPGK